jgi:hypothetical protein
MSFYLLPGIRFNDCVFSDPVRLADWTPPSCGGVVVVLAHDPNWAPKGFRPLYFAEFGNDAGRNLTAPPAREPLFAAALALPYSTTAQRRALRDELVSAYNPASQAAAGIASLPAMTPARPRNPIGFAPQFAPATESGS